MSSSFHEDGKSSLGARQHRQSRRKAYDVGKVGPLIEKCNLFKNYEFFVKNVEPPSETFAPAIKVVRGESAAVEKEPVPATPDSDESKSYGYLVKAGLLLV